MAFAVLIILSNNVSCPAEKQQKRQQKLQENVRNDMKRDEGKVIAALVQGPPPVAYCLQQ